MKQLKYDPLKALQVLSIVLAVFWGKIISRWQAYYFLSINYLYTCAFIYFIFIFSHFEVFKKV